MADDTAAQDRDVIAFGAFTLAARERLLVRDGSPVEIGTRALDILIALATRPNEIISKHDLLARVWPDISVEEGSLRFHIAGLRKALGDGKEGARYIATVTGRGYCFVAPISRSSAPSETEGGTVAPYQRANLPNRLARMVGRTEDARSISAQLSATRFVTIVGTGGVGKTTIAMTVGHELADAFAGAVHFVDLGALSDAGLVTTTIASLLGLSADSNDAVASLVAYLKGKRILLILDTCEHLIDAVAEITSHLFAAAPQAYFLATSREALRVEGEHVYRLSPLNTPPEDATTPPSVQGFSAVQLFAERAAASGARLHLENADAAIVGDICRKLDGLPLAIELAAGRVEAYGLKKLAELLDQHLNLLGPGRRTAPARQRTLQATLDWSYELLSDVERAVLRRLAIFIGHFTMESALEIVSSPDLDQDLVLTAIDGLIAKSMVAVRPAGAMMRYRLLDTTRAYAIQTSTDDAERIELAAQHAAYYVRWLEQTGEQNGRRCRAPRSARCILLASPTSALLWNGRLAPTETRKLACASQLLQHLPSWPCRN